MNIDRNDRGDASEAIVEQALNVIARHPKKGLVARVVGFVHAKRNSALDRKHIDFLVTLETGDEIPLQVKSSERGRRKFMRKYREYGRYIPVIVVKATDALESIINKVTGCIILAFNKLRREANRIIHKERVRPTGRKTWCVRFHAPLMCH